MKAVVAAFNQEKALVGAFSVITNLRMELLRHLYLATCCQVRPDPVTMVPTEQLEEVARDWVRAVTGLQVDTVPQFIQLLRAEDDTGFKLAR